MTFKDFCIDAKIRVAVAIDVNDEIAFEMEYEDLETALKDGDSMRKAIDYTLESLWSDLPDPDYK